jgi:hypothetical protein
MASLLPYKIIQQAMLRIGAYKGIPSEIVTNYANSGFTTFETEVFPIQSMHDALVMTEQEMAQAVSMNQNNVLRANIADTVLATAGGLIPAFGSSSSTAKIIGEWGQVRDADSGKLLVPALREEEIRIIEDNPTLFISSFFAYALRPPRIYATVTNLSIDCCVYDYDARQTAIDANGALLFPMAEAAYFDGLMSTLKNEDATLTRLSDGFEKPYAEWLAAQQANRNVTVEAGG